jgi:hypothetical protein
MESFKASTHYTDWEGTASADSSDALAWQHYLEKRGLIKSGEFLLATSLWVGEIHDGKVESVFVRAFLFKGPEDVEGVNKAIAAITGPIPVRAIDIPLKLEEFFGLFKQFELILTWHGIQLEGHEYLVRE